MKIKDKFSMCGIFKFLKKLKAYFWKRFDRSFYKGTWSQFVWLFILLLIGGVVSFIAGRYRGIEGWHIVELIIDPGSFVGAESHKLFQLCVVLFGAIVFTCLLINTIGNWIERRVERYRDGGISYDVDDHILILGSGENVVNLVETLLEKKENAKRDIVILTSVDAEELRAQIFSRIERNKIKNIYVFYGSRVQKETLMKLDAFQTKSIYILGEDDEPAHDSINMKCYQLLKDEICIRSRHIIDCYLIFDSMTSIQLFYHKEKTASTDNIKLTVVHSLENLTQRVLVSRYYREGKMYPALDREGITDASPQGVHLIVVNMSAMGYAMAVSAAHLCHFPNFMTKGIRSKITFVQTNIQQEMNFFVGRYRELMRLSYWKYIDAENPSNNFEHYPDSEYIDVEADKKGFLDVEWEFVDGGVETPWVRRYIEQCVDKDGNEEYLTMALCDDNSEVNTSAALFMPESVYDKQIPMMVYQPGGDQMIQVLDDSEMYSNIYPFGMRNESFDFEYYERLTRARKVRYLYSLADKGKCFRGFPSDNELAQSWYDAQYVFQQSNIYSANSVVFKLRSISNPGTRPLTTQEIDLLSVIEHNRWNVERLLMGFKPYTLADRRKFISVLKGEDKDEINRLKNTLKIAKFKQQKHKDIAPYNELLEGSKLYDRSIVANILKIY